MIRTCIIVSQNWLDSYAVELFLFLMVVMNLPATLIGWCQMITFGRRIRAERTARPRPAPKHAAIPIYVAKSYADLARKARAASWRIERVGGGHHVAWISPAGIRVLAPSTPRQEPSPRFLATLRHAGLDVAA